MIERAKPSNWGTGEKLTSAQMNRIDEQLPYALDGVGGGAYSPSPRIEIAGDGIRVTGPALLEGEVSIGDNAGSQLTVYADTYLNRDVVCVTGKKVTFNGEAEFNGQNQFDDTTSFTEISVVGFSGQVFFNTPSVVDFQSGFVVSAGNITIAAGNLTLSGGELAVVGGGAFSTGITVGGAVVAGEINVASGALQADSSSINCAVATRLGGATELAGIMTPTGSGRVLHRFYDLPDADGVTVDITMGNIFIVPSLGAARFYAISNTGAVRGDVIMFSAVANTGSHYAEMSVGYQLRNAAGLPVAGLIWFDGANWKPLAPLLATT